MGLLEELLDRYAIIADPNRAEGDLAQLDALRFIRGRLLELGPKDTEKYYKALPAIRDRYIWVGPAGDVVRPAGGVDVEVVDAALPDPGLDWSF